MCAIAPTRCSAAWIEVCGDPRRARRTSICGKVRADLMQRARGGALTDLAGDARTSTVGPAVPAGGVLAFVSGPRGRMTATGELPMILHVGGLHPRRNVGLLIDAWPGYARTSPRCRP